MKKDKTLKIAESVLERVGGKQNIAEVLHCQTRLRFNLKGKSIANHEKVEAAQGVLGVVGAGRQVQVVIDPEAKDVYNGPCELGNFGSTDRELVSTVKERITLKSIENGVLDTISGSMGPVIPAVVASTFFRMLVAILGPELLNVVGEGNDLYTLFTLMGNIAFCFLPVTVNCTSVKKFNLDPVTGILMGAILIHPILVDLMGRPLTIYGIPCNVQSYASSIVPIILSNWVVSYIAEFFDCIVPGAICSVFASALIITATLPIALCVFGLAGVFIGQYVVDALFSLEGTAGFIEIGLTVTLYPVLVMTGMHTVLITTLFRVFTAYGSDRSTAVTVFISGFSIMGVGIGASFWLKNKEQRTLTLSYGITVIVAGISEPTIYGIRTKYKKPFIGFLTGGLLGGVYAGSAGIIDATLAPSSNVFAALCFLRDSQANVVNDIAVCTVTFIPATLFVYFFGFSGNEKDIQR